MNESHLTNDPALLNNDNLNNTLISNKSVHSDNVIDNSDISIEYLEDSSVSACIQKSRNEVVNLPDEIDFLK